MVVNKKAYVAEMREYWQKTRCSGILGTKAMEPPNFEQIIGDYYDKYITPNAKKKVV